jgi:excisionase family DNA binding protein
MNSRSSSNERILFFSIADVAEWLGVSARTVRRWIKSGVLVAHRIKGIVRIAERDLREFLDAHRDD